MRKLYVVGIGPGSKDYLSPAAKKAVESSDVVVGSRRAIDLFEDVEAEKIELGSKNVEVKIELAISKVEEDRSVSVLSTGDPGFSGILKPVLKKVGDRDDIHVEVVPGISSIQLCAARLQIPWDGADLITLHGKGISKKVLKVIDNGKPTIILPNFKIDEVANFLIENGANPDRKVAICERLSYDDEKIVITALKGVLEEEFSYMCIMVVY